MKGKHEPRRRRHRVLRVLGDVMLLFLAIAFSFAVYGACLFLLVWVALKFA